MPRIPVLAAAAIIAGLVGLGSTLVANAATTAAQANTAWNTMTCADFTKMDKAHQADVINQISAANTQPATTAATAGAASSNANASGSAAATAAAPATAQAPGANLTADKLAASCGASPSATLGSVVPAGQVTSAGGAGASSTTTNNQ